LFIVPTLFVMTWNEILFTFSVQKQTKTWTIFQNFLFLHCLNLTEKISIWVAFVLIQIRRKRLKLKFSENKDLDVQTE